jgi:hypothetical protein
VAKRTGGGGTITVGTSSNYTSSSAPQSTVTGNVTDTGLSSNTLYTYDISLNNGNGVAISLTTQQIYTLASGTSTTPTALSSSRIQLNWTGIYSNAVAKRTGGTLSPDSSLNYILSSSPQSTVTGNVTDTGLLSNTLYTYDVSLNNGNNIAISLATQQIYTWASGSSSAVSNVTSNSMQVNWTGIYTTASVVRSSDGGSTYTTNSNYPTSPTPQSSVTGYVIDTNLLSNTQYTYAIQLINGNGFATNLTSQSGTTIAAASYFGDVSGYVFQLNGGTASVPLKDSTNIYTITNTGPVSMANDTIYGYVFNFTGANYLTIQNTLTTPVTATRTFWLSTSTPSSGAGNVMSSNNWPNWFAQTNTFGSQASYPSGTRITAATSQTTTWKFYAVTVSSTQLAIYVNGNTTPDATITPTSWTGDLSAIQIGAYQSGNFYTGYITKIRSYNFVLTPSQITALYNFENQSSATVGSNLRLNLDANSGISGNTWNDSSTYGLNYLSHTTPAVTNSFASIIANKSPWGIYNAADWNSSTNVLPEARGTASRNATGSGSGFATGSGSGFGATASIPFVSGTTASVLTWPTNSIPTNFTVCSITRYVGPNYGRILTSVVANQNWLHGHYGSKRGVAYYEGWKTQDTASVGNLTNWLTFCGVNGNNTSNPTPNNILLDNTGVGTSTGGTGNYTLGINNFLGTSAERSEWALSYLIIWDQVLTPAELSTVSTAMNNYLSSGILPLYNSVTNYTTTTYNGYTVATLNGTSNYLWYYNGFGTMASVFPTSSSFTYDVWCYPSSVSNMCVVREFGQNTISGGFNDAVMGFRDGYIRTGVYNSGTGNYLSSNSTYTSNTWYNIILVYNGTTHYLYVNGVLQNSVNVTRTIPTNFYLSIGLQDDFGYLGGVSNYFGGNIGAVKVYNTSFNNSQVIQNYNALAKRYTQVEPLLVTARQWFDASGNYRVTTVSNRVSSWIDNISPGSINAFQTTDANRPYYGSPTTNIISYGLHMIDFKDSGANSILTTNATLTTTTALTICCAIYYSGTNSTFSTIFSTDGTFTTGSIQLFITSTNTLQITVSGGALPSANPNDWLPGYTFSVNNAYVIVLNITSGTITVRVNGSSFSTSITNNIAIRASLWNFGNWSGDLNRFFSGGIGEFIYFNSSLTLANMQMIEGYLGWKWGVSKTFISTHPHFNFPPVSNYSFTFISTIIYSYTGADQTITVPSNATRMFVQAWGAGGGSRGTGAIPTICYSGGGGGYASAYFTITPSQSIIVIVGGGGATATSNGGGTSGSYGGGGGVTGSTDTNWRGASGGGRSAVRLSGGTDDIITAGGGGAGGTTGSGWVGGRVGGSGGGTTGGAGVQDSGTNAGGGTQSAGGIAGNSDPGLTGSGAGSKYQGGTGGAVSYASGGGGGYYGGGATTMGAAGGGSGYVSNTALTFISSVSSSGSGSTVANPNALPSTYTSSNIGSGGAGLGSAGASTTGNSGKNGLVVITYYTS